MTPAIITGRGVRLRSYRESDADDVAAACSDPLTRRFISTMPDPYTRADAVDWISRGAPAVRAAGGAAYAIADPATDQLIGGIGVERFMPARRQAEIGYWVAPWARRRGVATAATTALAEAALTGGVERLELLTEWENVASQRVALAAGFRREGVRRGAGSAPGRDRYDLLAWVRLAGDPADPVRRPLPDLPDTCTGTDTRAGALTDGVVVLRPLGPADVEFFLALQDEPEVAASRVPPGPVDRAEVARRCARSAARWLAGERAELVVVDAATAEPVGLTSLYYTEPALGTAMIGYLVARRWRGRGYAGRAVRLLAGWAFRTAGIDRLTAGTLPDNHPSQRVLEKVGFRREGTLRGQLPAAAGGRSDGDLFGLLPTDLRDRSSGARGAGMDTSTGTETGRDRPPEGGPPPARQRPGRSVTRRWR